MNLFPIIFLLQCSRKFNAIQIYSGCFYSPTPTQDQDTFRVFFILSFLKFYDLPLQSLFYYIKLVGPFHCHCCSIAKSCRTLFNPTHGSTTGLPVPHQHPEFAQVHIHWTSNAIQLSHLLLPSSPFAFNLSQHQGLF